MTTTEVCGEVTSNADDKKIFIIHAGMNDVSSSRPEELLEKYRKMICYFRTKTNKNVISGILPRMGADRSFYSKACTINNRLDSLCSQVGVDFVNLWDDFYNKSLFLSSMDCTLTVLGLYAWADFSVTKFFFIDQKMPRGREQQWRRSYSV